MKVLNLYAGLGGNRADWAGVKVTAVEYDQSVADFYANRFPKDDIVIGDAHQFLLKYFQDFDVIWSSPPCQTHSSFRFNIGVRYRGVAPKFPDMRLYEEVVFLRYHARQGQRWLVENVKPYYDPLIEPSAFAGRHLFWSNVDLSELNGWVKKGGKEAIRKAQIPQLQELHGISLDGWKIKEKRQKLRNCVDRDLGLSAFEVLKNGLINWEYKT